MRTLLIGIVFSMVALPTTPQTDKERDHGVSQSEFEHRQLRDLLATQSGPRGKNYANSNRERRCWKWSSERSAISPATNQIAVAPSVPETRNPDPNVVSVTLPDKGKTLQGGGGEAAQSTNRVGKSDSIELANGKVRIGTLLYAVCLLPKDWVRPSVHQPGQSTWAEQQRLQHV